MFLSKNDELPYNLGYRVKIVSFQFLLSEIYNGVLCLHFMLICGHFSVVLSLWWRFVFVYMILHHIGVLAMLYGQYNLSRDIAYFATCLKIKFIYWLWWFNEEPLTSMEPLIWTKGFL